MSISSTQPKITCTTSTNNSGNNSLLKLKDKIVTAINFDPKTKEQKTAIFKKFIQIIHCDKNLESKLKLIGIVSKLLELNRNDLETIIKYSKDTIGNISYFSLSFTNPILDLLNAVSINPNDLLVKTDNQDQQNLTVKNFLFGMNLSGLDLSDVSLMFMNLSGADLSNANLSNTDLTLANLSGADLSNANLSNADLSLADLCKAKLENVQNLNFVVPKDNHDLETFFNHITNARSSLKTIHSISEEYLSLKIQLMESIINQIDSLKKETRNMVFLHRNSIEDILLNTNIYFNNSSIISDFIYRELLPSKISCENVNKAIFSYSQQELFYEKVLDKNFCLKNSGFISQFIYYLKKNDNFKEMGIKIESRYLSNFPYIQKTSFQYILNDLSEINESSESLLENNILLISPNEKSFLIVSYGYYEKFMLNMANENISWDNISYFKCNDEILNSYKLVTSNNINLEEIFNEIVFFKKTYEYYSNNQKISAFLSYLNLGKYSCLFKEMMQTKKLDQVKKNSITEKELMDFFRPYIQMEKNYDINSVQEQALNLRLTSEFNSKIMQIFNLNKKSPSEKAQAFACLAGFFTKLSSICFLGTELSSPLPVRNFAIALLNEAIELDENQVPNHDDWKNKLAGVGGAFTCTDTLFNEMANDLKNKPFYSQIIPPAWI